MKVERIKEGVAYVQFIEGKNLIGVLLSHYLLQPCQ